MWPRNRGRPSASREGVSMSRDLMPEPRTDLEGFARGALGFFFVAHLFAPAPVVPATITVDEALCTLVDAITSANIDEATGGCVAGDAGADTIELMADVLLTEFDNEEFGPTGLPVVRSEIRLKGNGHTIDIDTDAGSRIFAVSPGDSGSTLTVENTTVSGAEIRGDGGGFYVDSGGSLRLIDTFVEENVSSGDGGGIRAGEDTTISLENTSVLGNQTEAPHDGAGIWAGQGSTVILRGSTISGNFAVEFDYDFIYGYGGNGGGIYLDGASLTLVDSSVRDNTAAEGGGGIFVGIGAVATLVNSTVTENRLVGSRGYYIYPSRGGAGLLVHGEANLLNSSVSNNTDEESGFGGAGLRVPAGGVATLANSAVTRNRTFLLSGGGRGTGILTAGDLTLINATVSGNIGDREKGDAEGAGLNVYGGGNLTVKQSTIVGNFFGSHNLFVESGATASLTDSLVVDGACSGAINDLGRNFTDSAGCPGAPIVAGVDIAVSLADNGGPTETHALLEGSVAVDAAGDCGRDTDQRALLRDDGSCDSGSFELRAGAPTLGLFATGTCPGQVVVDVVEATPEGSVQIFRSGAEGSFTLPPDSPCAGTTIALDDPRLLLTGEVNGGGRGTAIRPAQQRSCRLLLQALDLTRCVTSNVARLP